MPVQALAKRTIELRRRLNSADEQEEWRRAVRAVLAEPARSWPAETTAAAHRLLADSDELIEHFRDRVNQLLAMDRQFRAEVIAQLGPDQGHRGDTIAIPAGLVPAIWWRCCIGGCTLEPQPGSAVRPHRFRNCPTHAVPLVRT